MSVIKWAGGKARVLPVIQYLLDTACVTRYIDLFCGSICIPYTLGLKTVVLNDINTCLITVYKTIKTSPGELLEKLEEIDGDEHNTQECFERYREEYNRIKDNSTDPIRLSALFIYLNKRCYNGLYRENSKGYFNVPFRKYKTHIYDKDTILSLSKYLNENNVLLTSKHYKEFSEFFRPGDVVYLDPPYDSSFTQYWKTPFGKNEQLELRDFCLSLDSKGVRFIQSNSPTMEIRELYKDFYQYSFYIGRQMRDAKQGAVDKSETENEIVIWNYQKILIK